MKKSLQSLEVYTLMLLIFLTALGPSSSWAQRRHGGSDGGGGNICYLKNGRPVLLEFASLDRGLVVEGTNFPNDLDTIYSNKKNLREYDLKHLGFTGFDFYDLPRLSQRIDQVLNANETLSPNFIGFLRALRGVLSFDMTTIPSQVTLKADLTHAPPDCDAQNIRASVIYTNNFYAMIDLKKFNSLDLDSQAGLYFHEQIRVLQNLMDFFNIGKNRISDQQLQEIVNTLFYDPKPLDDNPALRAIMTGLPFYLYYAFEKDAHPSCDRNILSRLKQNGHTNLSNKLENGLCQTHLKFQIASNIAQVAKDAYELIVANEKNIDKSDFDLLVREAKRVANDVSSEEKVVKSITRLIKSTNLWSIGIKKMLPTNAWATLTPYNFGSKIEELETEPSLSEKDLTALKAYKIEACSAKESVRDLMNTGDSSKLHVQQNSDGSLKLVTHPRCEQ